MTALEDDLSCPVCLERLTPPLVQCSNGHSTCSKCIKIEKCPICRAPFLTTPSRVLDRILHLLPQPCLYVGAGCPDIEFDSHQDFCVFRPIKCPLGITGSCPWSGTVKEWLDHEHEDSPTLVLGSGCSRCIYKSMLSTPPCGKVFKIRGEDNHFILSTRNKSGILSLTIRHVFTDKPTKGYFFRFMFFLEGKEQLLFEYYLKPSVFKDNQDEYDDCKRMDSHVTHLTHPTLYALLGVQTTSLEQ